MIKLNLGSGNAPRNGFLNIDRRQLPTVDIVRDVLRGLPFADDSVGHIYSENFLEHLPQTEIIWMFNEMWRVLEPGRSMQHLIPQAGTALFFQDPTHTAHFSVETFTYFELNHVRNLYYGGEILPWIIDRLSLTDPNRLIDVHMIKA